MGVYACESSDPTPPVTEWHRKDWSGTCVVKTVIDGLCKDEHHKAPDNHERYDFSDRTVREWVADVMRRVAQAPTLPVLIHCKSGKDRTGVVVAAICAAMGVPQGIVKQEFTLSRGGRVQLFEEKTLPTLFPAEDGSCMFFDEFSQSDLDALRARLRPASAPQPCLPSTETLERMKALKAELKQYLDKVTETQGRKAGVVDLAQDVLAASMYAEYQLLRDAIGTSRARKPVGEQAA